MSEPTNNTPGGDGKAFNEAFKTKRRGGGKKKGGGGNRDAAVDAALKKALEDNRLRGVDKLSEADVRRVRWQVRRKRIVKASVTTVAWTVGVTCLILAVRSFSSVTIPEFENCQVPISSDRNVYAQLDKYVHYIVDRVNVKGYKSIDSKWVSGTPPAYRREARSRLEALGAAGFSVEAISGDNVRFYDVKCRANDYGSTIVFIEVKRVMVGGKLIYRLSRVM